MVCGAHQNPKRIDIYKLIFLSIIHHFSGNKFQEHILDHAYFYLGQFVYLYCATKMALAPNTKNTRSSVSPHLNQLKYWVKMCITRWEAGSGVTIAAFWTYILCKIAQHHMTHVWPWFKKNKTITNLYKNKKNVSLEEEKNPLCFSSCFFL